MMRKVVIGAVLLALTVPAVALPPTVGPEKRIDVNGGTFAANETSAAAVVSGAIQVVGTWNDYRDSPTPNDSRVRLGVGLSTDGGASWNDFLVRPPAPFQSNTEGDPMTAADPRTGALWVGAISFAFNGGVYVARKDAGDNFFQPAVMADADGGTDKCWMVAGRDNLTADSTRLYITYNLGSIRSDDLGDSWTNPVSLGNGVGYQPRIGPAGELFVAYWNFGNDDFELRRSFDGGQSFTVRTITQRMDTWGTESFNSRFAGTFRVAPLPSIAVSGDTIYAVWPDTTDMAGGQANVDVYFARSDDDGDSWTTPVVLNGEGPNVGDQFFPWIEVDADGRLHVVFLDSRHTAQNDGVVNGFFDAYYAYSEDAGDSWNEIRLTDESWNSADDGLEHISQQFIGDYLGMGVADNKVFPVYISTREGDTDVYTREITFQDCALPGEVQELRVGISPSDDLKFNWSDQDFVFNYELYEDNQPDGPFGNIAGSAFSGSIGISVPAPPGDRYYLVAGRNGCGVGPK